jgi:hypothetical protein
MNAFKLLIVAIGMLVLIGCQTTGELNDCRSQNQELTGQIEKLQLDLQTQHVERQEMLEFINTLMKTIEEAKPKPSDKPIGTVKTD